MEPEWEFATSHGRAKVLGEERQHARVEVLGAVPYVHCLQRNMMAETKNQVYDDVYAFAVRVLVEACSGSIKIREEPLTRCSAVVPWTH